jgi:hypothetical protein
MKLNRFCCFAASAVVGLLVAEASVVWAQTMHRRVGAPDCLYDGYYNFGGPNVVLGYAAAGNGEGFCPFNDELGVFEKDDANNLDVYVQDSSSGASGHRMCARACVLDYDSWTAYCGSADCTSSLGTGWDVLTPSLTYWQSGSYTDWFGYTQVYWDGAGGYGYFHGYAAYD